MGSKASSQQNTSSATFADPQAAQDYDRVINRAINVSKTPYQAYGGELTAGVNSQEQTATNAMNGLGAAATGYYGQAAEQSGLGAAAVNPTAVNGAAISQYESPYQSDVIDATMAQIDQQNKIQQNQQTSNAIGAGAFGGDRAGLASAALAGQQALATNSTLANLNNQNYSQALSEANTQQQVGLGAAQANRAALQQNAETLAGIGSAATNSGLGVANAQLGAGALQQQTQQASDTAQYGQFEQKQAYPFQTEQYLANIVGGIAPNYGSETYGQTTTQTSPLNAILGAGLGAAALAPGVSSIGSGLSSLGSSIGGMFSLSDRRAKEDLRKIGKTFDGQPIYAFRYKGQPETRLGLVAQEVQKKHPDAVGSIGGLKTVDYAQATRAASDRGHFARGGRTLGGAGFEHLTREEVAHLDEPMARADGGVVAGVDAMPFGGVVGYVPTSGGLAPSRMLTSPSPSQNPSQPTNPIPNFSQFSQAGQGLGAIGSGIGSAASGLGSAVSDIGHYVNGGMNSVGMFNFADGGKVVGLGAARLRRRGYDGGGVVGPVVGPEALAFDPDAFGSLDASMQPGLGAATVPQGIVPAPQPVATGGLGSAMTPPVPRGGVAPAAPASAPQGLGAATNDNAPIPVAPAPVSTPVLGYSGGVAPAAQPAGGLGAITAAAPASGAPLGSGFGFDRSVNRTLGFEGGLNASDTNGTPSNYGINQAANPDIDVAKLTPDQAKGIYKSRYWDAIDADKLPPPLAHVAFDTAVVAGPERAKQMIAQSGGDPSKFMDLRDSYLNGLIQSDPGKYGKYASAWGSRDAALRNDIGAGGPPASALGYAGGVAGGGSGGLGSAAQPATGLGAAATPSGLGAAGLAGSDASSTKGGLGSFLGFGAGGNGGLLGLSDDARMGLLGMAAGMMGSTSKSFGVALGQGAQVGLQQYGQALERNREAGLARAKIANSASEIQNRNALQGIERDKVTLAGQELAAKLGNYASEAKYRDASGKAEMSNAAANTGRLSLERYQVIAGPDNNFMYFDKLNPGAGLMTPAQVAAASGGTGPAGAAGSPSAAPPSGGSVGGTPAAAGAGPAPSAAAAAPTTQGAPLDSTSFMKSGNPTLSAPRGYMPRGYYQTAMRAQNDPVMRDTLAKQTEHDVSDANERAQKAYSSTYVSDEMDRNAAALPNSGLLVPGSLYPERLGLAKNWNMAMTAMGLDGLQVDPNAAKAGETLLKDKTRLGAQLTQQLGSREAAAVFGSMLSAVPGADNTRAGYKAISSSIRVLAQRDVDKNAFYQDWAGRYGNTLGAEVAFNQLNPAMQYARQAQALARIPQDATELIRAHANDPQWRASFEKMYGAGTSRYYTGQFAQ